MSAGSTSSKSCNEAEPKKIPDGETTRYVYSGDGEDQGPEKRGSEGFSGENVSGRGRPPRLKFSGSCGESSRPREYCKLSQPNGTCLAAKLPLEVERDPKQCITWTATLGHR